jgi:hypothetical protein
MRSRRRGGRRVIFRNAKEVAEVPGAQEAFDRLLSLGWEPSGSMYDFMQPHPFRVSYRKYVAMGVVEMSVVGDSLGGAVVNADLTVRELAQQVMPPPP